MICSDYDSDFGAVLSGDFTRAEFKRANRHLAECASCREVYGELGRTRKAIIRGWGEPIERKAPVRIFAAVALAASLIISFAVMDAKREETVVEEIDAALVEIALDGMSDEELLTILEGDIL